MPEDKMPNPCYPCKGDGELDGHTCPYCNGLGVSGSSTWTGEDDLDGPEECPCCGEVTLDDDMVWVDDNTHVCKNCAEGEAERIAAEKEEADRDYRADMKRDARSLGESVDFDRFMSRIISEETRRGLPVVNDSPLRKNAQRYQERPMGKTRMRSK